MVTLANLDARTLVPSLQSPGLTAIEQEFRQGRTQRNIQGQVDILAQDPGGKKEQEALIRLGAINPAVATSIRQTLASGDAAQLAAIQKEAAQGLRDATLVNRQKDIGSKRRAILNLAREKAAAGQDPSRSLKLLEMPEDQLNLEIQKMIVQGTDIKTLLDNQQKQLDRESKERIEAAKISAQPIKAIQEREINVTGGLKQRQRLNPGTKLFENVGTAFDPSVKSPAKIAEEKAAVKFKGTEDFLNASLLEEKKLDIKEKSKTGRLKRKKLESEIREIGLNDKKKEFRRESKIVKADLVLGKIAEAKSFIESNWGTTGFMGSMLSSIGGTDARNLRGMIDTIKANIGFAELQAMRDASPTGGALGQVAVQEINFLQSTIAALDQGQSDEILLQNLEQVAQSMRRIKQVQLDAVGGGSGLNLETTPAQSAASNLSDEELLKGL